jgi:hypothetical protein
VLEELSRIAISYCILPYSSRKGEKTGAIPGEKFGFRCSVFGVLCSVVAFLY